MRVNVPSMTRAWEINSFVEYNATGNCIHSIIYRSAEVAERQTRYVQDVVPVRVCGFKSLLRHQLINIHRLKDNMGDIEDCPMCLITSPNDQQG